jgi:hypothetical protein
VTPGLSFTIHRLALALGGELFCEREPGNAIDVKLEQTVVQLTRPDCVHLGDLGLAVERVSARLTGECGSKPPRLGVADAFEDDAVGADEPPHAASAPLPPNVSAPHLPARRKPCRVTTCVGPEMTSSSVIMLTCLKASSSSYPPPPFTLPRWRFLDASKSLPRFYPNERKSKRSEMRSSTSSIRSTSALPLNKPGLGPSRWNYRLCRP